MALRILPDFCANCSLCFELCPVAAVRPFGAERPPSYHIDPERCTECVGHFAWPRCIAFCRTNGIVQDLECIEDRSTLLRKWNQFTGGTCYAQDAPYGLQPLEELGDPIA